MTIVLILFFIKEETGYRFCSNKTLGEKKVITRNLALCPKAGLEIIVIIIVVGRFNVFHHDHYIHGHVCPVFDHVRNSRGTIEP